MTKTLMLAGESRLPFIERVTAALGPFLREQGFADAAAEHVKLAVAEAVANAIQHGNQGRVARRVEVTFESREDRLTVSVRDEGPGFDAALLPDALAPQHLLKPSGRGVLLMRTLMDSVEFSTHPQGGQVVHLSKQKHAVPPNTQEKRHG
ncbi:ATP-binding protein [Corallococcus terminator]|uniref:ATP-binding protein n=1 Tax=Corallococcus terminator TaxID=2316733 RepID=A0A3A8I226_9BACT|nr:ATP-binding protein [Corallococcus terminator]RKG73834.1 ATP-binding protein [Corallococcus terminator]